MSPPKPPPSRFLTAGLGSTHRESPELPLGREKTPTGNILCWSSTSSPPASLLLCIFCIESGGLMKDSGHPRAFCIDLDGNEPDAPSRCLLSFLAAEHPTAPSSMQTPIRDADPPKTCPPGVVQAAFRHRSSRGRGVNGAFCRAGERRGSGCQGCSAGATDFPFFHKSPPDPGSRGMDGGAEPYL